MAPMIPLFEGSVLLQQGAGTSPAGRLVGLLGIVTSLFLAWLMSRHRRRFPWRMVGIGVALQAAVGLLILRTGFGRDLFAGANRIVTQLLRFQEEGARFVFGNLVQSDIAVQGGGGGLVTTGAVIAFNVLPTIIFFSALTSILYYLGVMQRVIQGVAWVMQKTLRTSGAETLTTAGNIFVGQTEAPLLVRPFVGRMTLSELNVVMVSGFATVAGGVLAAYVGMLSGMFPDIAGHLLTASVMNAPAAMVIAKVLVPETDTPATKGFVRLELERTDVNVIDAAASGAGIGWKLAMNVGAMLIAFVGLIALTNAGVEWIGQRFGLEGWSLQGGLGLLLRPLAWTLGVPWQDSGQVGALIGVKTILTEFVAYAQLGADMQSGSTMSPKAMLIATYALLGFANLPSIAVQIGGIGGIAPERRQDLSRLGLRAMVGGNLAAFMSAAVVGILA